MALRPWLAGIPYGPGRAFTGVPWLGSVGWHSTCDRLDHISRGPQRLEFYQLACSTFEFDGVLETRSMPAGAAAVLARAVAEGGSMYSQLPRLSAKGQSLLCATGRD
ncbi:hypothetical protein [Micromonospora coxensis]|uniref:hypothetical protein n=1 Tax=Micromonospora coxensis TaxID=356852 RepID=UPI00341C22DF